MADLEKQFDEAMMNVYRTAKDECGYNATYFLRMLHDKRGIATARQLLAKDGAQYGFESSGNMTGSTSRSNAWC